MIIIQPFKEQKLAQFLKKWNFVFGDIFKWTFKLKLMDIKCLLRTTVKLSKIILTVPKY